MRQTSLEAYREARHRLGEKQDAVLRAVRSLGQATDKDLAGFLLWPINQVTPRRGELARMGLVTERAVVVQDGRRATAWTTT